MKTTKMIAIALLTMSALGMSYPVSATGSTKVDVFQDMGAIYIDLDGAVAKEIFDSLPIPMTTSNGVEIKDDQRFSCIHNLSDGKYSCSLRDRY